jgi:antirestriction protein
VHEQPRVWVACLAAYNNGKLHGRWVDVDDDEDALWEKIREVLKSSPEPLAEEWAFHDHEYLPGVGEHSSVEHVCAMAALVLEHGHGAVEAAANLYDDWQIADVFANGCYRGTHDSEEDYLQGMYEDMEAPGQGVNAPFMGLTIANYIDWAAVARDTEEVRSHRVGGELHVFDGAP